MPENQGDCRTSAATSERTDTGICSAWIGQMRGMNYSCLAQANVLCAAASLQRPEQTASMAKFITALATVCPALSGGAGSWYGHAIAIARKVFRR